METKKKILILHHGSGLGGGLVALLGLIDELKQDYDVSVYCIFISDAIGYLEARGVTIYTPKNKIFYSKYNLYIHSEASYVSLLSSIKFFYYFILALFNSLYYSKREFKSFSNNFDILYLNSLFVADWLPYSRKYFKNIVVHVREPLAKGSLGIRKNIFRLLLKKYSDLIVCVSEDNKRRVNIPIKSVRIYDPVVLSGRMDLKDEIIKQKDIHYFVYLGGSQRIKGFEQFVNCLDYLEDNIKIFFLGSLTELEENTKTVSYKIRSLFSEYTRKTLRELKLRFYNSDKLVIVGKTDNVFNYYKESKAVICPFSKPHASLPILEAFSVGRPVVVSDVEGMTELFEPRIMNVFENGKSNDLANKINNIALLNESELSELTDLALIKYESIKETNPNIISVLKNI